MEWTEVAITIAPAGLETLLEKLSAAGFDGVAIEDPREIGALVDRAGPYWDLVDRNLEPLRYAAPRVKLYLPAGSDGAAALAQLTALAEALAAEHPGWGAALATGTLLEEDWANSWKQFYKPIRAGRRLAVVPSWESWAAADGEILIHIDPGMAFGTGTHQTTRLCLELLEARVRPGDRVLDLGCGSGILSIAAVLLGAASAEGSDIDQVAVAVAEDNACRNGVADRVRYWQGDLAAGACGPFQLVSANIVADVILRLIPDLGRVLAPGGVFIASGIIRERADEVAGALAAAGWRVEELREDAGWAALAASAAGK